MELKDIKKMVECHDIKELFKYFYVISYSRNDDVTLHGEIMFFEKAKFKKELGDDCIWYKKIIKSKNYEIRIVISEMLSRKQIRNLLK